MITVRPLSLSDMPAFHALCKSFPARLLTPRLNIDAHGLQGPVVSSWGAFSPDDRELAGIVLRYGNTAIAVDRDGTCATEFARLIDGLPGIAGVRGSLQVVTGIQALLHQYVATDWEDSHFLCLNRPPVVAPEVLRLARPAGAQDLDKLAELYSGAGGMYRTRSNVAKKLAETRVFVVEEPPVGKRAARIASCALLNVEGSDAGLIGGVYTLPSARGKGYAAACTAAISRDLQRDGKMPCLFYENPIAGKVYRKLGFEDASRWAVLYLALSSTAGSTINS